MPESLEPSGQQRSRSVVGEPIVGAVAVWHLPSLPHSFSERLPWAGGVHRRKLRRSDLCCARAIVGRVLHLGWPCRGLLFLLLRRRKSIANEAINRALDSILIVPPFRFQEPSLNECVDFRYV
jgi:hypothetical protein